MASAVVSVSDADCDDVSAAEPELAAVLPDDWLPSVLEVLEVFESVSLLLPLSEIELSCAPEPSAILASVSFLHAELKIAVENRRAMVKLKAINLNITLKFIKSSRKSF
jgi:hypothetical protein